MFSIGQRPKGWKGKQRLIDQDGKDVCFLLEWRRFFDKCSLVIAFVPQPLFSFNDNHFAIMLRQKPTPKNPFGTKKVPPFSMRFALSILIGQCHVPLQNQKSSSYGRGYLAMY